MRRTTEVEVLLRLHAPQVLGAVVRRYGRFGPGRGRRTGGAARRRAAVTGHALSVPETRCLGARAARLTPPPP